MMKDESRIEFRKERDFGQLISVTFEFIKREFKMLTRLMIYIAGPLIVVSLLINIPASIRTLTYTFGNQISAAPEKIMGFMGWTFLATIIQGFASLLFFIAVNEFIKFYEEGKTGITIKDIFENVKKRFWMYFGGSILVSIMVIAGMVILLIPGFYLGVATSFVFIIITMENTDVGEAIKRSFQLVKDNWWATFGFYILIIIIEVMIIYTVALPLSLLNMSFLAGYFATGSENLPIWYYFAFSLFTIFSILINVAASTILYVAVDFKYFSLIEKKEQIGLKRQIELMGKDQDEEKQIS